jgi:hypothetical protein
MDSWGGSRYTIRFLHFGLQLFHLRHVVGGRQYCSSMYSNVCRWTARLGAVNRPPPLPPPPSPSPSPSPPLPPRAPPSILRPSAQYPAIWSPSRVVKVASYEPLLIIIINFDIYEWRLLCSKHQYRTLYSPVNILFSYTTYSNYTVQKVLFVASPMPVSRSVSCTFTLPVTTWFHMNNKINNRKNNKQMSS